MSSEGRGISPALVLWTKTPRYAGSSKKAKSINLELWAERKPERRNVDARIKKFWRVLKQNGVAVCGELSHMASYAVCLQMHVKIHGVFFLPACEVLGIAA